jgi:hypothetical protein
MYCRKREGRVICYLSAVILAILALVVVIVVLTMMVTNQGLKRMEKA